MESNLTTRPVIPSLGLQDESYNNETIELLQERLNAAEEETQGLVEQLAKIGYSSDNAEFGNLRDKKLTITPYKIADPEILQKNYEVLVSRVCKTESALQTLKLTLTRVQADRDVNRKEKLEATEKLSKANAAYEKQLHNLQKDLAHSRKDEKAAQEDLLKLKDEVRHMKDVLDTAAS